MQWQATYTVSRSCSQSPIRVCKGHYCSGSAGAGIAGLLREIAAVAYICGGTCHASQLPIPPAPTYCSKSWRASFWQSPSVEVLRQTNQGPAPVTFFTDSIFADVDPVGADSAWVCTFTSFGMGLLFFQRQCTHKARFSLVPKVESIRDADASQ